MGSFPEAQTWIIEPLRVMPASFLPADEPSVEGVPQHDLQVPQLLEEGGGQVTVPPVESQSGWLVTPAGGEIWGESIRAQKLYDGLAAGLCGRGGSHEPSE
ncbi:hypothetical protein ScoT_27800 [Streptomyces albidoflavus]|uniref:Uncharacterized protein n=1 Tax=Streptomyces albidoflavus TaxID=1886 RepID=A0AA37BYI9_9ACTN|nr:hypothetical protein ScoT_27800 [Streptomyces albidoflavus]